MTNIRRTSGLLALGLLGLTACGPTLGTLPLPGKGVSGDTQTVTMEFEDALNLAQGAPVKVNGVDEGKVQKIGVENYHAKVELKVKRDAQLKTDMKARLRYTTPLGELYVDVYNPTTGTAIPDGFNLPIATPAAQKAVVSPAGTCVPGQSTCTAPTVEDSLSQASLLINGGGLGSLKTISTELQHAFVGKEPVWRDLIGRLNTTVTQANATTKDFDAALTALNGLSVTLGKNRAVVDRALKEIAPAAAVLKSQAPNVTQLLIAVQGFATQANSTLQASRTDLLTTLSEVQPVLAELVANKGQWAKSLDQLVVLAKAVQTAIPGDYLNLAGTLTLSNQLVSTNVLGGATNGGGLLGGLTGGGTTKSPLPLNLGSLLPGSGTTKCTINLLGLCL